MLLLVLILVLIAFGLLVVALLSGSVLWAWVSVVVSVAAAAVLLIDWLQRRNAVKAGTDAAAGTGPDASRPRSEVEPVTEILPVIPPSGVPMAGAGGVNGAPRDVPAARFDQVLDGTQTVIMPVVQPSGSSDRPPGATPGISPSGGDSSPSVTKTGGDRSSSVPRPSDAGDVTGIASGSAEKPAIRPDDRPAASAAPSATSPEVAGTAPRVPGTTGVPSGASAPVPVDLEKADRQQADRDATDRDTTPEPGAAPASDGPADRRDASAEATVAVDARQADTAAGPAVPDGAPADGSAADAYVEASSATAAAVEDGSPAGDATATTAVGEATAGEPVLPPPGSDVEPPEEPRDVAAAALIAALEDEVLVIDEQPRYHVESCRSLAGHALIPLPAREAIELGFTPCGWCAPDRTLASRYPAPAR